MSPSLMQREMSYHRHSVPHISRFHLQEIRMKNKISICGVRLHCTSHKGGVECRQVSAQLAYSDSYTNRDVLMMDDLLDTALF